MRLRKDERIAEDLNNKKICSKFIIDKKYSLKNKSIWNYLLQNRGR